MADRAELKAIYPDASDSFLDINADDTPCPPNDTRSRVKSKKVVADTVNPYKRHTVIKMPYIKNLSVNHYKFNGGKFTKPEVKEWMNDLVVLIKNCHVTDWKLPLKVTISGTFKDGRIPDTHNILKIICDSVEDATGLNDKFYSTETTQPVIDKKQEPNLVIRIEEI